MKKFAQEKIFLKSEADKYFERNGPQVNKFIIDAIKFLKPNKDHKIFEIGCGSGATLKKIETIYKSNVSGLDTSKKAINYAKKKYKLKNVKTDTFLNHKFKEKFDIVVDGGFLYVTPNLTISTTLKKIFRIMKKNSYFIFWDYDTPYAYTNSWKHNKKLKSYKRNYVNLISKINKNLYLISKKQFILKTKKEIKNYNDKIDIDKIITVMIFKKIGNRS